MDALHKVDQSQMLKDPYTDSDFFEHPGGILPCQLRPGLSSLHAGSGERLLMLALLSDAINVFLKGRADRRLLAQTRSWIKGVDKGSDVVSFEDACDAVGIDPEAMRERLFRLKYGDSHKPPRLPHAQTSHTITRTSEGRQGSDAKIHAAARKRAREANPVSALQRRAGRSAVNFIGC